METAKVFASGNSQAVRLPKECRFEGGEVYIKKIGNTVYLCPKEKKWETFLNGLNGFSDDIFENGRDQGGQPPRESV
jgi:antitoxin VapB